MKGVVKKIIVMMLIIVVFTSTSVQAIKIDSESRIEKAETNGAKIKDLSENDLDPYVDLKVTVTINKIRALEELDKFSEPDFFVKILINDDEKVSKTWKNQKFVEEEWSFTSNVRDDKEIVNIEIELWDEDAIINTLCDIAKNDNQNPNRKSLSLQYSLKSGHWLGDDSISWIHSWDPDYSGYGRACGCDDNSIYAEDDDCEIWFDITQSDFDGDGIPYWTEVNRFGTDPTVDDTGRDDDKDGVPIEWEWRWGQINVYDHPNHTWTSDWQYDPFEYEDHKNLDPDGDSLTNYEEYLVSEWYSDPFRKDIYVELDEMGPGPNGEPKSVLPEESKELIFLAFDRQNIVFHLDDGEMGGSDIVPFDTTGDNTTRQELDKMYYDYFLDGNENNWKKGIFHYGIVVYNATFPGFCYRCNGFQISSKGMEERTKEILTGNRYIVYASAYMHELGHSLGLMWLGGHVQGSGNIFNPLFWKFLPYRSIMNYAYMYGFYGRNLVDYSDGSRGKNDYDDWSNIDYSYFESDSF